MAAALLWQGQGGKKQSQQSKILLRASELFAQSITRELPGLLLTRSHTGAAVGSFPCPWGFVRGGSAERSLPKQEQSSCSPTGVPRACTGQESGKTWPQLPGMLSIQLLAAQPCNPPAFREF